MAPLGDFVSGLAAELVVTRSVRDAAAVLEWVADPPPGEPYFAPGAQQAVHRGAGWRPGTPARGADDREPRRDRARAPECVAAAEAAGRSLEALGHHVEAAHPPAFDDPNYVPMFMVRWASGTATGLKYWSMVLGRELTADDVEPLTWALGEQGRGHSAADYLMAIGYTQLVNRQIVALWQDYDLLVTPTMAQPPARIGEIGNGVEDDDPLAPIERAIPYAAFTAGFNSTGQPAISLPLATSAEGLPLGVQLAGGPGPRGPLDPGRVPARGDRAVGGAAAAAVRRHKLTTRSRWRPRSASR